MTDTATRERPILFSGEMVRAILDGRKTQTRRVVKLKHVLTPEQKRIGVEQCDDPSKFRAATLVEGVPRLTVPTRHPDDRDVPWDDCGGECLYAPYETGMRLWVRETWSDWHPDGDGAKTTPESVMYRADGFEYEDGDGFLVPNGEIKWRPSIHMPRWASRITLEITNVRVERLQAITSDDAKAEGVERDTFGHWLDYALPVGGFRESTSSLMSPVDSFRSLWDSINQARGFGWDANPWCWCIDFKRLEADNEA